MSKLISKKSFWVGIILLECLLAFWIVYAYHNPPDAEAQWVACSPFTEPKIFNGDDSHSDGAYVSHSYEGGILVRHWDGIGAPRKVMLTPFRSTDYSGSICYLSGVKVEQSCCDQWTVCKITYEDSAWYLTADSQWNSSQCGRQSEGSNVWCWAKCLRW